MSLQEDKSLMGELAMRRWLTTSCGLCHQLESMAENEEKVYETRGEWCV